MQSIVQSRAPSSAEHSTVPRTAPGRAEHSSVYMQVGRRGRVWREARGDGSALLLAHSAHRQEGCGAMKCDEVR